jgi:hypothetical protein
MEVQVGTELEAPNGRRYRLLAYLGGGKYSEVWRAHVVGEPERQVAVKIMASALNEKERRIFAREAERLLSLARAEEILGLRVSGHSLVPTIEAIADEFFVETLASGKPLDQILREEGRLPEPEALTIVEQLCRVFQALHEGLQRSYLDFQPRNVFWDYSVRRIMVVDWNLLSPTGEADVAGDLEAIARLFYRLVVGKGFSPGHLDEPSGWRTLTSGTRDILACALHPNPARRYPNAVAFREALAEQLNWWASESDSLLQEAAQRLEIAVQKRSEDLYRRAKHILDIAVCKGAEHPLVEQLRERAAAGLRCSHPSLRRGIVSLRTGDIGAAEAAFANGLKEAVSLPDRLLFLRWMEVARTAPRSNMDEVAQVVDALAAWTEAEWEGRPWIDGPAGPEPKWPEFLSKEWRAWQSLVQVRKRPPHSEDEASYRWAASNYREAFSIAQTLSYGKQLLRMWGDLEGQARNWEALADALRRKREQVEDLERTFRRNCEEGLRALREALRREPEREELTRLALSWAQQLFEGGQFSETKHFLSQIVLEAHPALLGRILFWRKEAEEALLWQRKLEEVKRAFRMLAATGVNSDRESTIQEKAEQQTKWQHVLQILWDVVGVVKDNPSLRHQSWSLFRQVFTSPVLPERLRPRLEEIGPNLAPDEKTWVSFRQEMERLKEIGPNLAPDERTWVSLRQKMERRRREQAIRAQIERHRRWAEDAAGLGLVSKFPDAIRQLGQALRLAEELGDQKLSKELKSFQQEYIRNYREINRRFQWSEELARKQDWSGLIRLLEQIKERFGISGWNRPGEIEEWLTEFRFREQAVFLQETSNRWEMAEPEERKELLRRMKVTLEEMRKLTPCLNKRARAQLNRFEERYRSCYYQLHPPLQTPGGSIAVEKD